MAGNGGNRGSFKPGDSRAGRKPGTPNALTRAVKETLQAAWNDVQADPKHPANTVNFSREFPREFWAAATKLIPSEIQATVQHGVTPEIGVLLDAMGAKKPEK